MQHSLRIGAVLWFSVAVLGVNSAICAQIERISTPRSTIPRTYFGMHIHGMVAPRPGLSKPDPWPDIDFGSWRLLSAYVDWPNLEPAKGQWKFSTLDQLVNLAQEHNVEILLPLVFSPSWASSRPNEKSQYSPGNAAPPSDINDWRTYVRTVAMRYKGRIQSYEIWNEPNVHEIFSGSPEQMIALTQEANKILKEIDPNITVVSPSATTVNGVPWLRTFLSVGGAQYVDVIGYHFYVWDAPEKIVPLVSQVRDAMSKFGFGSKPLWDTEAGWEITNRKTGRAPGARGVYGTVISDDQAVAYLARSYVLNWAYGVSRFYWYAWDDGQTGITEPEDLTPKSAAKAYNEIERWLVGSRMMMCDHYQATWNCRLQRDGGYSGWIVWNTDGSRSFPIQPSWGVKRTRDLAGGTQNLSGAKTVEIGPKPILLENQTR